MVQASQRADLSFRVGGTLNEILVREGQQATRGQLLARLDPTDFRIALEDRQAVFDNAERNFERAKELIQGNNLSRLDYDRLEAEFRTAQAALSQARQNLDYTEMRAPFDGTIGRREVENFEDVRAKQTIFRFQNVALVDISIDLPESLVRSVTSGSPVSFEAGGRADLVTSVARFEGRPGSGFPLTLKEIATKADAATQTFRVTMSMPQPEEFRVLPGMTATVEVDLSKVVTTDVAKWVPASAVQADGELAARVWKVDPETMTVHSMPVEIGRMSGDQIEVTEGLFGGEELVSVGAAYLSEGMRVTRMPDREQAEPRSDEVS